MNLFKILAILVDISNIIGKPMKTTQITIDAEVFLEICTQKQNGESENNALRRILGLDRIVPVIDVPENDKIINKSWTYKNTYLEAGTKLRIQYNGGLFNDIKIANSTIIVGDKACISPSEAVCAAIRQLSNDPYKVVNINGWSYLEFWDNSRNKWRKLNEIRGKYNETRGIK